LSCRLGRCLRESDIVSGLKPRYGVTGSICIVIVGETQIHFCYNISLTEGSSIPNQLDLLCRRGVRCYRFSGTEHVAILTDGWPKCLNQFFKIILRSNLLYTFSSGLRELAD